MLRTDRKLWKVIALNTVTFGIYGHIFWKRFVRDVNTVCREDGGHTRGIFAHNVLSVLTLGIYDLVWDRGVAKRLSGYLSARGVPCAVSARSITLWDTVGRLTVVGPLVVNAKLIHALNLACTCYSDPVLATRMDSPAAAVPYTLEYAGA